MMDNDNLEAALIEAENLQDDRITQAWDPNRRLGTLYASSLKLRATAWDVYLLYHPGVRWTDVNPPTPTFWMHQLPTEAGVNPDLALNPGALAGELAKLLESEDRVRPDIHLELHAKGLFNVKRERGVTSLQELAESIDDPATRAVAEELYGRTTS